MPARKAATGTATVMPEREICVDSLSSISDGMSQANDRLETLVGRLNQLHDLIAGSRVETVTGVDVDTQKSVDRAFITVAQTKLYRGCDLMSKAEQLVEDIISSSE